MKLVETFGGLGEVQLRSAETSLGIESVERNQHVGQAVFKDGDEKVEAALEVNVNGAFRAWDRLRDGSGGHSDETALAQKLFGSSDDLDFAVLAARRSVFWRHIGCASVVKIAFRHTASI